MSPIMACISGGLVRTSMSKEISVLNVWGGQPTKASSVVIYGQVSDARALGG